MNMKNTLRRTAAATLFAAAAVTGVMLGSTAANAYNEAQAAPPAAETVETVSMTPAVYQEATPEPEPLVETGWEPGSLVGLPLETPAVAPMEAPAAAPLEDEPGWDCRIHGNETCGVQIEGTWYVVTFSNGQPVTVAVR